MQNFLRVYLHLDYHRYLLTDVAVDYVTNEEQLQSAVNDLSDNKTILIAPGEYYLSETLYIRHDNVTIKGDSKRCDEVILAGQGMENTVLNMVFGPTSLN